MTKPRNGVGGWIALAAIVLGGSAGGSYYRPQSPHNPDITTAAWVQMTRDVADLRTAMDDVKEALHEIAQRLPQHPVQNDP